jgi:hypothetical protein
MLLNQIYEYNSVGLIITNLRLKSFCLPPNSKKATLQTPILFSIFALQIKDKKC